MLGKSLANPFQNGRLVRWWRKMMVVVVKMIEGIRVTRMGKKKGLVNQNMD